MALTLLSDRAIRKACRKCGKPGIELYWAKDDARPDVRRGRDWSCVLVDKSAVPHGTPKGAPLAEDMRHACGDDGHDDDDDDDAPVAAAMAAPSPIAPDNAPAPLAAPVAADNGDLDSALSVLKRAITMPPIDRAEVAEIARTVATDIAANIVTPTRTIVVVSGVTREIDAPTHCALPGVLRTAGLRKHVLMVGPAGSGKSTLAENCATALDLPFYTQSCYPQMPPSNLIGWDDAGGNFHETMFIRAFTTGGVFCLDELDNSHPSTLVLLNEAISNGRIAIDGRMVHKHPDFILLATANTFGRGISRTYAGRQELDVTTLDRFRVKVVDYDEDLELAACHATGASDETITRTLHMVRTVRSRAADNAALRIVASPRASIGMCEELTAGASWDEAVNECLRKGIATDTWNKVAA